MDASRSIAATRTVGGKFAGSSAPEFDVTCLDRGIPIPLSPPVPKNVMQPWARFRTYSKSEPTRDRR